MIDNDEPIIAFAKNKSEEDCITVDELLTALKSNVFSEAAEKAPVIIHAFDFDEEDEDNDGRPDIHLLKIAFYNNDTFRLEAGSVKPDDIRVDEKSVIYEDYTHSKYGFISRVRLIEILEKFISKHGSDKAVEIRTSDDFGVFPLTQVFKCSQSCPSVHLCSGYYKN